MKEDIKKNSEDLYADTDFRDEYEELKDAEFISVTPATVKIEENAKEKLSKFYGEDDKLIGEKIIEKKSGEITEIKYDILGKKENVTLRDKNKKIKKSTDYYANGGIKYITDYGPTGSYKSIGYNIDGSRQSYIEKHKDGTADAVYYGVGNADKNLIVKLDANKQVVEKHIEE